MRQTDSVKRSLFLVIFYKFRKFSRCCTIEAWSIRNEIRDTISRGKDRLEILQIYKSKMQLPLSEEQIEYMAIQTGEMTDPMTGTSYTGEIRENKSSFQKIRNSPSFAWRRTET